LLVGLTSLDFLSHSNDSWCASLGAHNDSVSFYQSQWTNNQHYICQYDSKQP